MTRPALLDLKSAFSQGELTDQAMKPITEQSI